MKNYKYSLEEVCVENSTYCRNNLKARLFKLGIKKRVCEQCGLIDNWNGKFLSLNLDHINGIPDDNRLTNLRILCPNCHSQTETFGSKNAKKKKGVTIYYCECGEVKSGKRFKYCKKCSDKNKRIVKNRPSKEQLILEVEKEGYRAIGKKYGVSDNAVRGWINMVVIA